MNIYKSCEHIKRTVPADVDQDILDSLAEQYDTLPIFEKTAYEEKFTRHYSLQRNEYLKCRWQVYRNNIEKRVFEPFTFPDIKDLHFYNCAIRFLPSLTIKRQPSLTMKMAAGPGCDWRGQMPIPFELFMKRLATKKEKPGKQTLKKEGKKRASEENKDNKDVKVKTEKRKT